MVPENIQHHIDELLRESDSYREQADACEEAARLLKARFGGDASVPNPDSTLGAPKHSPLASWTPPGPFRKQRTNKETLPTTRAGWVAHALKAAGRPLKMTEIVDALSDLGQKGSLTRSVLYNAAIVAIKRKPEMFRQEEDGTWSLIGTEETKDTE